MKTAAILRQLRTKKGCKQVEVAIYLNVSIGTISNYENAVHEPDLNNLSKLADFYGVTTDYLLGRTEYQHSIEPLNSVISKKYTIAQFLIQLESIPSGKRAFIAYTLQMLFKALKA